MKKKILKNGLTCIVTLLVLSVFLTACPEPEGPPGGESGGAVVLGGIPLFSGSFEGFGGGVIQVFNENQVQGSLSLRSARNLGASGTTLVAAIEVEESGDVILLEGPYDPVSGMFNLSARTNDYVYMLTGAMDDSKEFFSPVVTILKPDGDNWVGGRAIIEPDLTAEFTKMEATSMTAPNMPAIVMGRHEQYNEWDDPADGPAFVTLISPAGLVLLERGDGGVYKERDDGCIPFVEVDQISSREIHAIISNNHFDGLDWETHGFPAYVYDVTGFDIETNKVSMTQEDWAKVSWTKYELWLIEEKELTPVRMYNKRSITISQGMLEGELLWGFSGDQPGGVPDVATVAEARALSMKTGSRLWWPQNFVVNNLILSWGAVEYAVSYKVKVGFDGEWVTVTTPEFDLSNDFPMQGGGEWESYKIFVKSIAAPSIQQVDWCDSWEAMVNLRYDGSIYEEGTGPLETPWGLTVNGMKVSWTSPYPDETYTFQLRISEIEGGIEESEIITGTTYTLPQEYAGKTGLVQVKTVAGLLYPDNVDSVYSDWVSFGTEVKIPILEVLKALPPQDSENPFNFDNADLSSITWGDLAELMGYSNFMFLPFDLISYANVYDGQAPNGFETGSGKDGFLELVNGDVLFA
ncbi:MAG: hypothetical protein FWB83_09605, partial [Treponema sp.]|nr:hypothetical protein [Treponema sp.]